MELKTVKETARFFNVCERTIFRWIEKGELKCIKIGNNIRISSEEIEDALNRFKK